MVDSCTKLAIHPQDHNYIDTAKAADSAMDDVRKEQEKRWAAFRSEHLSEQKEKQNSQLLQSLPTGSPVHVYRYISKKWARPFPLIQVKGETAVIQITSGRKIYSKCCRGTCKQNFGKFFAFKYHSLRSIRYGGCSWHNECHTWTSVNSKWEQRYGNEE